MVIFGEVGGYFRDRWRKICRRLWRNREGEKGLRQTSESKWPHSPHPPHHYWIIHRISHTLLFETLQQCNWQFYIKKLISQINHFLKFVRSYGCWKTYRIWIRSLETTTIFCNCNFLKSYYKSRLHSNESNLENKMVNMI